MSKNFTQQEYNNAKNVDILKYLSDNGYEIIKSGKDFMLKEHDSLKISSTGKWFWHSRQEGGLSPIALLKLLENINDVEAIKKLSLYSNGNYTSMKIIVENSTLIEKIKGDFILPVKHENSRRSFAYLLNTSVMSLIFSKNILTVRPFLV